MELEPRWPKATVWLGAVDIAQKATRIHPNDNVSYPPTSRCLLAWAEDVFHDDAAYLIVRRMLRDECELACGECDVMTANDNELSRAQCARIWNRIMKTLGYTERCERPKLKT